MRVDYGLLALAPLRVHLLIPTIELVLQCRDDARLVDQVVDVLIESCTRHAGCIREVLLAPSYDYDSPR